jgi:S-DNA-T family DNA segregation ATPase FtsK/SpoIIIE
MAVKYKKASASLMQRKLSVGYARAARILDQLERAGVVGPGQGAKPRDILISDADSFLSQRSDGE